MKKGFTLIELMVVVVIIGILAAIAIPNFVKTIDKAKVASVKANMHTMQVAVEGISVDSSGVYPYVQSLIEDELPSNFKNPYTQATGVGGAWNFSTTGEPTSGQGIVGYETDATGTTYTIMGWGKDGSTKINLILSPGQ